MTVLAWLAFLTLAPACCVSIWRRRYLAAILCGAFAYVAMRGL